MVTSLSTGDKIHIGDSLTLTILAIEGDLIRFGVESSGPGGGIELN
jgi:sRNA-binding carbon storage regulator CsrA